MKKIIYFIFLILWMVLIFILSHQTGNISGGNSGSIIETIMNVIYSIFNISKDNINEVIMLLHNPIRECAHVFEYFILGFLIFKNLENFNVNNKYMTTILCGFIFASFDEIHQLFIIGRTFQYFDILMDMLGICLIIIIIYNKKRKLND